jgi:hypothetical protein
MSEDRGEVGRCPWCGCWGWLEEIERPSDACHHEIAPDPTALPALPELLAALQPLVDASLRHPALAAHLPRLAAAVDALKLGAGGSRKTSPVPKKSGKGRVRSAATQRALDEVAGGMPVSTAARKCGVSASNLFRVLASSPKP